MLKSSSAWVTAEHLGSFLLGCRRKQRVLRPASEVACMETQLGPAGRYVDPVFHHSRRHYVGFTRDLEKAGSVVVETAVEHVGLFFVAKKVGLESSSLMLVQATDIFFFEPSIRTVPHRRGTLPCRI